MRLSETMIPEFDREMARTCRILASVPAETMSRKPHESLRTLAWNANHLVEVVGWASSIISHPEFDVAPVDGPKYSAPEITDPAVLLSNFDRNVASARAAIASASDETFAQPWSLKAGGQTLFTVSKGECIRTWVLNHTVHHRAILSVGLRMCGVAAAGVYDE